MDENVLGGMHQDGPAGRLADFEVADDDVVGL